MQNLNMFEQNGVVKAKIRSEASSFYTISLLLKLNPSTHSPKSSHEESSIFALFSCENSTLVLTFILCNQNFLARCQDSHEIVLVPISFVFFHFAPQKSTTSPASKIWCGQWSAILHSNLTIVKFPTNLMQFTQKIVHFSSQKLSNFRVKKSVL